MGLESLKKYCVKKKYSTDNKPQCLQDQTGRTGHMEGLEKTSIKLENRDQLHFLVKCWYH